MKTLSKPEIKRILKEKHSKAIVKIADKEYILPKTNAVKKLIFDTYFEDYKYTRETFDCDDFALVLHAFVKQERYKVKSNHPWAFGECWTMSHAFNFFIDENQELRYVEPQNDKFIDCPNDIVFFRL